MRTPRPPPTVNNMHMLIPVSVSSSNSSLLLSPSSSSRHSTTNTISSLHVPSSLRLFPLIFAIALLLSLFNFVVRLHLRDVHHRLSLQTHTALGLAHADDHVPHVRLPHDVDLANNNIVVGIGEDVQQQQQQRQILDTFPPAFDRPAHCVAVVPRLLHHLRRHLHSSLSTSSKSDHDSYPSSPTYDENIDNDSDFVSHKPRFNTRSFCLFSATCILPRTHTAPSRLFLSGTSTSSSSNPSSLMTTCRTTSPTLVEHNNNNNNNTNNVTVNDCMRLRKSVLCAHGLYSGALTAACADTDQSLSRRGYDTLTRRFAAENGESGGDGGDVEMNDGTMLRNVTLLHGVVVVVPAYYYMGNIYHYSHAIATATHVITTLQPLLSHWPSSSSSSSSGLTFPSSSSSNNNKTHIVTLLFRGNSPHGYGAWQHAVTTAVVEQHLRHHLNLSLSVHTLYEDEFTKFSPLRHTLRTDRIGRANAVCMQSAVLLGRRGTPNIWPFPSYTALRANPEPLVERVPVAALQLRAAIYAAYADQLREKSVMDVDALLSGGMGIREDWSGSKNGEEKKEGEWKDLPDELLLDMPKAAIGYARRTGPDDDDESTSYVNGTARRFSKRDESWLVRMLHDEASRASTLTDRITVTTLHTPRNVAFSSQLQSFFDVGIIVGIHGANLLNVLFTPSFSSLVEITGVSLQCYIYGANSGLSYWMYESMLKASTKQSRCGPNHHMCLNSINHRRIMIETERDRNEIRNRVRMGIDRVMMLRKRFQHVGGIPTVLDRQRAEYGIDWTKAK